MYSFILFNNFWNLNRNLWNLRWLCWLRKILICLFTITHRNVFCTCLHLICTYLFHFTIILLLDMYRFHIFNLLFRLFTTEELLKEVWLSLFFLLWFVFNSCIRCYIRICQKSSTFLLTLFRQFYNLIKMSYRLRLWLNIIDCFIFLFIITILIKI